jgi:hypothetical protein
MQRNYSTNSVPQVRPEPVYYIMIGSRYTGDAYYTRQEAARTVKFYRVLFPGSRINVGRMGGHWIAPSDYGMGRRRDYRSWMDGRRFRAYPAQLRED